MKISIRIAASLALAVLSLSMMACQSTPSSGDAMPACCAAATKAGKTCDHKCCVDSAKAGAVCQTCPKS